MMKSLYQNLLKPIAFSMDAENAHHRTMQLMKSVSSNTLTKGLVDFRLDRQEEKKLEKEVFGIRFPNPVGLAAGFDKDGKYYDIIEMLGFGFIEIGTVTPLAQAGNPSPRLFRLPQDQALINRMGFNNDGVKALVSRLNNRPKSNVILGGNIGKNKNTPNEKANDDYAICFQELYNYVDYFVVNISSPNTPGLRELQEKKPLMSLLSSLVNLRTQENKSKPILLKIAPDMTHTQIDEIISCVKETGIDGLILNNTTISRDNLKSEKEKIEQIGAGGLSGKPLTQVSNDLLKYTTGKINKAFPTIGVGGIMNPDDAVNKLNSGADLIQIYSGMIYYGPTLVSDILKKLLSIR